MIYVCGCFKIIARFEFGYKVLPAEVNEDLGVYDLRLLKME